MYSYFKIRERKFLFWWIVGSVFAWPLAITIGGIVAVFLGFVGGMIGGMGLLDAPESVYLAFIGIIFGSIAGFSVGAIQRLLLHNHLYWTSENWLRLSTIGGALGGVLLMFVTAAFDRNVVPYNVFSLALFLLPLGLAQWFSLRKATRHSWLWVAANGVAGFAFMRLLFFVLDGGISQYARFVDEWLLIFGVLAIAIVPGWITGVTMLHLFKRHSYELDTDTEPQPTQTESIWDHAV